MKQGVKTHKEKEYKDMVLGSRNFVTFIHGFKHPLFISSKKKDEYKDLKKLGTVKTVIGILSCVLILIGAFAVFVSFIMPYFMKPAEKNEIPSEVKEAIGEISLLDTHLPLSYDKDTGLPVYDDGLNLFVINSSNPADENFIVPTEEYSGVTVDKRIVSALRMMVDDAGDNGIIMELESGLITFEGQKALYDRKVEELVKKGGFTKIMARAEAKKTVPVPGEADEQTGMVVKIKGESSAFKGSDAYNWLNKNAADYGFVFRFPDGKNQYTGRAGDNTVIRYVGKQNAMMMRQLSMCLEEYISYISNK